MQTEVFMEVFISHLDPCILVVALLLDRGVRRGVFFDLNSLSRGHDALLLRLDLQMSLLSC